LENDEKNEMDGAMMKAEFTFGFIARILFGTISPKNTMAKVRRWSEPNNYDSCKAFVPIMGTCTQVVKVTNTDVKSDYLG